MRRLVLVTAFVCVAAALAASCVLAARTVTGLVVSNNVKHGYIRIESEGTDVLLVPNRETRIMRGERDKPVEVVTLAQIAPGDRVVAVIKDDETVVSIKGFYTLVRGNLAAISGSTITLEDGQSLEVLPEAKITLPGGKNGKLTDFKPGSAVTCRLDPISRNVWSVSATKPSETLTTTETPAPKIESVTYEAPEELSSGDVVQVKVVGTPKSSVRIEIPQLSAETAAEEAEPGIYVATIRMPEDVAVTDVPVVAHMSANGKDARPVQAARLLTISAPVIEPAPVPAVEPAPAPAPPEPVPAPEPAPEPTPPPVRSLVVAEPANGASVLNSLTVRGTAQPDARVSVQISYSNGRLGLLELTGTVTAQTTASDNQGTFSVGPLPLTGLLATKGLSYHIVVRYVDLPEEPPVVVDVYGAK